VGNRAIRRLAVVLMFVCASVVAGCGSEVAYESNVATANAKACGGDGCHDAVVTAQNEGRHVALPCEQCHGDTGKAHADDPKATVAVTDWTIAGCSACHTGEASTYLYDDNKQVGPFGGSIRKPPQPKSATFPEYKTIVAGHAFAKDYNEEGAHTYVLEDHYATTRGKFETCMQCKSTKVALAFKDGTPLTVAADTPITLTHTATGTLPPKTVQIPKGTTITYKVDDVTRVVDAQATLPDGTVYTSHPAESEDATQNFNMLWASTVAATIETWPYGAGCNHCHDPHSGELRLVRMAEIQSIEGSGGPTGSGGANPYDASSPKSFDAASDKDRRVLICAQCHVEYVCGRSGVDKQDRDAYGWAKAKDLHEVYSAAFDYKQDWIQSIIGQPLIKSQHPESELYWESVHYDAGASCGDCHMPEVRDAAGRTFRSHWFTSPYKYEDPETFASFAASTGLMPAFRDRPCDRCHEDRMAAGVVQQQSFFAAQSRVESLLAQSVTGLGAIKTSGKDTGGAYDEALAAHRKAHVLWENLAVSENSMGFHNFEEVMSSMSTAEEQARLSLAMQQRISGTK